MYNIMSGHIFHDGNKRAGLASALLFLKMNKCVLNEEIKKTFTKSGKLTPKIGSSNIELLVQFTLEVASGKIELEECQNWFKENIRCTS